MGLIRRPRDFNSIHRKSYPIWTSDQMIVRAEPYIDLVLVFSSKWYQGAWCQLLKYINNNILYITLLFIESVWGHHLSYIFPYIIDVYAIICLFGTNPWY